MRSIFVVAATAAAALAVPAAASAATFNVQDFGPYYQVTYTADPAGPHTIQVSGSPQSIIVTDSSDTITTNDDAPCQVSADEHTLVCGGANPVGLRVVGGDAADTITSTATGFLAPVVASGRPFLFLDGGNGNDTLRGGSSGELLVAGAGADTVRGGGGDDTLGQTTDDAVDRLFGEGGDDLFQTDSTGGLLDGGPGRDMVFNFNTSLAVGGNGMTYQLAGATTTTGNGYPTQDISLTNIETALGGPADDTLIGSAGSETLIGLGGRDTITGGGGTDFLYGFAGNDLFSQAIAGGLPGLPTAGSDEQNTITSQDGAVDVVDCGPAGATLLADDVDVLSNCPAVGSGTTIVPVPPPAPVIQTVQVQVPGPAPAPAPPVTRAPLLDTTKATISGFKAPTKADGKALRKTGSYSVTFTANEAVSGSVALVAKAGRVATIASAGDLELAAASVKTTAGAQRTVKLTVAKKLRKLLKKGRRFVVVVTLVDAGGNVTTKRQTVTVS